ncbi:uncharacterized protein EI97DRAFT_431582 [Westerdykella ornata]|uniref:MARVEL domain-containing protein n=1 Tax=Westerdykella ornata TaxID=318751 RepID=A0A6A6JNW1_WESOR|nr:uncharacterized protein EI97DRAFT_431582 [Westerdykella ornata]KAF2278340.1 hypothetical protein EI97DRAFT_431582 [Westerdykella ornata]
MTDRVPEGAPHAPLDEAPIPNNGAQPATPGLIRRLDAAEELWVWKLGLRALAVLLAVIGIGCMAWVFATRPRYDLDRPMIGYDDSYGVWTLVTFTVSAVWCTTCILVLLLRRPNKPVHPGAAVGIDLVLWLSYIPTAMLALYDLLDLVRWGSYGYIETYGLGGDYKQAPNGTWVWVQDQYDSYYGRNRECDGRYSAFENCAEQDAFINQLYLAKAHREAVEKVGVACQFINLALHLALFIWACVDTHRRNRRKVHKDAEKLASDIVMKMIRSGAVVPAQNQGSMQQPLLQNPHMHQQSWGPAPVMPPPAVLGQEKGEAARYG